MQVLTLLLFPMIAMSLFRRKCHDSPLGSWWPVVQQAVVLCQKCSQPIRAQSAGYLTNSSPLSLWTLVQMSDVTWPLLTCARSGSVPLVTLCGTHSLSRRNGRIKPDYSIRLCKYYPPFFQLHLRASKGWFYPQFDTLPLYSQLPGGESCSELLPHHQPPALHCPGSTGCCGRVLLDLLQGQIWGGCHHQMRWLDTKTTLLLETWALML